jgi:hypothetical protein
MNEIHFRPHLHPTWTNVVVFLLVVTASPAFADASAPTRPPELWGGFTFGTGLHVIGFADNYPDDGDIGYSQEGVGAGAEGRAGAVVAMRFPYASNMLLGLTFEVSGAVVGASVHQWGTNYDLPDSSFCNPYALAKNGNITPCRWSLVTAQAGVIGAFDAGALIGIPFSGVPRSGYGLILRLMWQPACSSLDYVPCALTGFAARLTWLPPQDNTPLPRWRGGGTPRLIGIYAQFGAVLGGSGMTVPTLNSDPGSSYFLLGLGVEWMPGLAPGR